ncbi:tigger transposable element-derived protein [Plakobranchus ocellatus]|uniref:Tigger transposable element-derived protein n=1 Tax=Plakobranchus ocellatus TaxID=259542 RepID=A0AAV4BML6_9GAST|nr:tigger transposable element-derived protein [Plakobranchus ocellatus]
MRKLDRHFLPQGRSIILILDNCSAHPRVLSDLQAITLLFLPPNTTSRLQPCDQGLSKNFKMTYHKRVLQKSIYSFDETGSTDANLKMSLLDAIVMAAALWDDITPSTIQNCFRHAGFKLRNYEAVVQQKQEEPTMQVSPLLYTEQRKDEMGKFKDTPKDFKLYLLELPMKTEMKRS